MARSKLTMSTIEFDEEMLRMIEELKKSLGGVSKSYVIRRAIETLWEIAPMADPDLGTVVVSTTGGTHPRPVGLFHMLPRRLAPRS